MSSTYSIPNTSLQCFPFCSTIVTHILTKANENQMFKLSKSCKYFYQRFFGVVERFEITKNKVICFKNGKSWKMPLHLILLLGISITQNLSIHSSNALIITKLLTKIQYSNIQELVISESYISFYDLTLLTSSGSIKKLEIVLNKCMNFPVDPMLLIRMVPNAVDIHIEQEFIISNSQLKNLQQNSKIQKFTIIGGRCDLFENNFLKNNLGPNAEVFFGIPERESRIHIFQTWLQKNLLNSWNPQEEKPMIECESS